MSQYGDDFGDRRPTQSGMSTGVKVLIGLLIGGVVLGLICCGGVIYIGKKAADSVQMVETPAEVDAMTQEMVKINIPERFTGEGGFRMEIFGVGMGMVAYKGATEDSTLLMFQSMQPGNKSIEQQRIEIEQQMEAQGHGDELDMGELEGGKTEKRMLTVRGEEYEFVFSSGTLANHDHEFEMEEADDEPAEEPAEADPAEPADDAAAEVTEEEEKTIYHHVSGAFPGEKGMIILVIQLPEDEYDEEEIVNMIETIQ